MLYSFCCFELGLRKARGPFRLKSHVKLVDMDPIPGSCQFLSKSSSVGSTVRKQQFLVASELSERWDTHSQLSRTAAELIACSLTVPPVVLQFREIPGLLKGLGTNPWTPWWLVLKE